jgi:hypothetical protein
MTMRELTSSSLGGSHRGNTKYVQQNMTAGFEGGREELGKRKSSKVAARRIPPPGRMDRLEESLYWLLSAAALVYLFLGLIGF